MSTDSYLALKTQWLIAKEEAEILQGRLDNQVDEGLLESGNFPSTDNVAYLRRAWDEEYRLRQEFLDFITQLNTNP